MALGAVEEPQREGRCSGSSIRSLLPAAAFGSTAENPIVFYFLFALFRGCGSSATHCQADSHWISCVSSHLDTESQTPCDRRLPNSTPQGCQLLLLVLGKLSCSRRPLVALSALQTCAPKAYFVLKAVKVDSRPFL